MVTGSPQPGQPKYSPLARAQSDHGSRSNRTWRISHGGTQRAHKRSQYSFVLSVGAQPQVAGSMDGHSRRTGSAAGRPRTAGARGAGRSRPCASTCNGRTRHGFPVRMPGVRQTWRTATAPNVAGLVSMTRPHSPFVRPGRRPCLPTASYRGRETPPTRSPSWAPSSSPPGRWIGGAER